MDVGQISARDTFTDNWTTICSSRDLSRIDIFIAHHPSLVLSFDAFTMLYTNTVHYA
jgi:hypothetical protein